MKSVLVMASEGFVVSVYEVSAMIRGADAMNAEKTELDIVDGLCNAKLLTILNDGTDKNVDTGEDWFRHVIDRRCLRGLPTVVVGGEYSEYVQSRFAQGGGGLLRCDL